MTRQIWAALLRRFGQNVEIRSPNAAPQTVRAFLQPILEANRFQKVPTPLGSRRDDRFLYLGPPQVPLEPGVSQLVCRGQLYFVQSAQPVGLRTTHHWQAVLRPGEESS